jgi:HEAT repeat protein
MRFPILQQSVAVVRRLGGVFLLLVLLTPVLAQQGDVVTWVRQLQGPDAVQRMQAAQQLGKLGDRTAVAPLIAALQDELPAVRGQAATALGLLGDPKAVPSLVEALGDEFVQVRTAVVTALGGIRDPAAVEALLGIARANAGLRTPALQGLVKSRDLGVLLQMQGLLTENDGALVEPLEMATETCIESARKKKNPPALDILLGALADPNPAVRGYTAACVWGFPDPRIKAALVQLLTDPAPKVRLGAVSSLGSLQDADVTGLLLPLTHDPDVGVRRRAVSAIAWRNDPQVLPTLLGLVKDADARVRQYVAYGLGVLHDPQAIDALIALVTDTDERTRTQAIRALSTFTTSPQAKGTLRGILQDPHAKGRSEVAGVFRGMCTPEEIETLLFPLLQDADPQVRLAATKALAEMNDPRVGEALLALLAEAKDDQLRMVVREFSGVHNPELLPKILALTAKTTDAGRREQLLQMLTALVYTNRETGSDLLIDMLSDPDAGIKKTALLLLQRSSVIYEMQEPIQEWLEGTRPPIAFAVPYKIRQVPTADPRLVEALLRCLEDPDAELQAQAAGYLGGMGDPRALAPLLALLKSDRPELRTAAVQGLAFSGDARALAPLIEMRKDIDKELARGIWEAIAMLQDVHDPTPIFVALQDPDWQVRSEVIQAIGLLGEARGVEPLINILRTNNDGNGGNRERAALLLGLLGDDRAVEPLIAALHDPVEWVRSAAAWALGKIGDRRAIEPLAAAANPGDARFQVRIATALIELGDARGWPALAPVMTVPDAMTRSIGAVTLVDHPDPRAIDLIVTVANDGKNWYRQRVLPALTRIKDPRAVAALEKIPDEMRNAGTLDILVKLRQGDADARAAVAAMLGGPRAETNEEPPASILIHDLLLWLADVNEPQLTALILKQVRSENALTRVLAGRVLARWKDARGVPPLLEALKDPRDVYCYAAAAKAITEIDAPLVRGKADAATANALINTLTGGTVEQFTGIAEVAGILRLPGAYHPLLARLRSDSSRLREASARGLGKLGDRRAVVPLTDALRDASSRVRLQAAMALGALGDPQAINPLISVLQHERGTRMLEATARALQAITGQDLGTDAARWRTWRSCWMEQHK